MPEKFVFFKKTYPLLALAAIISLGLFWPYRTPTRSAEQHSAQKALENYDIRTDPGKEAGQIISDLTGQRINPINPTASVPDYVIEYSPVLPLPEIISPAQNFLTGPDDRKRTEILRRFIAENSVLFGLDTARISKLKITADYTNPDGNLSFVHLAQELDGIPVFQGEVKAGFTKRNELIRVINNLAPNIEPQNVSKDFGSAGQAVLRAAEHIGMAAGGQTDTKSIESESNELKITFEPGRFAAKTTAEKFYFPLAAGVLRPAWRVLLWPGQDAFYVLVDAETGTLLWRKNISAYQTEPATYNVYDDDSPTPFTPGPQSPNIPFETPFIQRATRTFIGNETPFEFNNLGWIPDGANITSGNNAIAGIDRDGINGVDPDGTATGNPYRTFSYTYNPTPGDPPPGEEPVPAAALTLPPSQFQKGSATHAFYWINRFHDETYLAGFTEAAGNFQNDNFGRGGIGGDRVLVEVQDSAGTNNANFSTPADGTSPRGQFFIFLDPDPNLPDRDIAIDTQLILHEFTHGLSSRLHGNTTGIGGNMARGMGEGWSDFYAQSILSRPTDPTDGLYPNGSYAAFTSNVAPALNRYRGLRRFPTAIKSAVGSNGLPHNPLTFADIDQTQVDYSDGAFPAPVAGHLSNTADSIGNIGELWTVILWEVRGRLIAIHGPAEGNRRALQYVTDGMKLSPLNPNMIQSRDAIIAAVSASDPADVASVRQGFAARGMGSSAQVINAGSGNGTARVTESFDTLNVFVADPFLVSDPNGNGNGFPEPGELVSLSVSLTNATGVSVSNVLVNISGGPATTYGEIANGETVTRSINYFVPAGTVCGSFHEVTININSDDAGQRSETRDFRVGIPIGGPARTFENTTPVNVPFFGSNSSSGPADPYPTAINVSGLSGNKSITVVLTEINHTWVSDIDILLEGPGGQKFVLMSDAFSASNQTIVSTLSIRDRAENTMPASGLPPVSGDFKPTNHGTGDDFDAPAPAGPYQNPAPAGTATLASVFGTNSSNLNGEWRLWIDDDAGGDTGIIEGGWKIIFESADYICGDSFPSARADFDGDGRTDISVFRPTEGNWYLNQSSAGFSVLNWGIASDQLVPGDFDGDGRTDIAVFRPETDSNLPDFYILNSNGFIFSGYSWGLPGDIPSIADYDGDGRADISVFRPAQDVFYVLQSASGNALISRPNPQDKPVALDFDGDGKGDFATYHNGQWLISKSTDNHQSGEVVQWGLGTDLLVPADYDGDGRDDPAVFRPSEGVWYIRLSTGGNSIFQFGLEGDIPVPGDYDGDGRADAAVYRDGVWYINRSSAGILITQFGLTGDMPIPNRYLP